MDCEERIASTIYKTGYSGLDPTPLLGQTCDTDVSTDDGLDNPYLNYKAELINGLNFAYRDKKQISLKRRMKGSGKHTPDHSESSEENESEEN